MEKAFMRSLVEIAACCTIVIFWVLLFIIEFDRQIGI
jgi:hypothetical protein